MLSTCFEQLRSGTSRYVIWFSAAWCGPCQRMDREALIAAAADAGLPIYYADYAENETFATTCDIKQFPTFVLYQGSIVISSRASADTTKVCQWLKKMA